MKIIKRIIHNAEGKVSLTKIGVWLIAALQALKMSNLIAPQYLPIVTAAEYFAGAVGLVGLRDAMKTTEK